MGIEGGMDFVVKTAHLSIEKYITEPQQRGDAPSRVFISLDLKNMFNEILRTTIFRIIAEKYPELLPFVSLLYDTPGQVFYKMSDGQWHDYTMEEGVNQGCPLSSILAAMVLNEVLAPLTVKLRARAAG